MQHDPGDSRFHRPRRLGLSVDGLGFVLRVYAVTDRNPIYLKAIYPAPVELVNRREDIPPGGVFIQWDAGFDTYRLTRSRRAIPLGRFSNVHEAIFNCRRTD